MKISKKLPQFRDEKALIIVTGLQEAKFYIAQDGVIEKIKSFVETKPKFSDKEGYFQVRSKGKFISGGSVYEYPKDKIRQIFIKSFSKEVKKIKTENRKITSVYIFSPIYSIIQELLPKPMQNKVKFVFKKDLSHIHPFELLKKIREK